MDVPSRAEVAWAGDHLTESCGELDFIGTATEV